MSFLSIIHQRAAENAPIRPPAGPRFEGCAWNQLTKLIVAIATGGSGIR